MVVQNSRGKTSSDTPSSTAQENVEFSVHNWTLAEVKDTDKIKLQQMFKEMKRKRRLEQLKNMN